MLYLHGWMGQAFHRAIVDNTGIAALLAEGLTPTEAFWPTSSLVGERLLLLWHDKAYCHPGAPEKNYSFRAYLFILSLK